MILPLKEMILKSMVPGDEDSTVIKEAKEAIAQDLHRRYTNPDLTSKKPQPWSQVKIPALP